MPSTFLVENFGTPKAPTRAPKGRASHRSLTGGGRRLFEKEKALHENSEEIAELIQQLEQLRPSHVYGKGENGETAQKAEEIFKRIKALCQGILENEV